MSPGVDPEELARELEVMAPSVSPGPWRVVELPAITPGRGCFYDIESSQVVVPAFGGRESGGIGRGLFDTQAQVVHCSVIEVPAEIDLRFISLVRNHLDMIINSLRVTAALQNNVREGGE